MNLLSRYERIRRMSPRQMARYINYLSPLECTVCKEMMGRSHPEDECPFRSCTEARMHWLEQEMTRYEA